jgi:hypothetical protein
MNEKPKKKFVFRATKISDALYNQYNELNQPAVTETGFIRTRNYQKTHEKEYTTLLL